MDLSKLVNRPRNADMVKVKAKIEVEVSVYTVRMTENMSAVVAILGDKVALGFESQNPDGTFVMGEQMVLSLDAFGALGEKLKDIHAAIAVGSPPAKRKYNRKVKPSPQEVMTVSQAAMYAEDVPEVG